MNDKWIWLEKGTEFEVNGVQFKCHDIESYLWNKSYVIHIKDNNPGIHVLRHKYSHLNIYDFYKKYLKYCRN